VGTCKDSTRRLPRPGRAAFAWNLRLEGDPGVPCHAGLESGKMRPWSCHVTPLSRVSHARRSCARLHQAERLVSLLSEAAQWATPDGITPGRSAVKRNNFPNCIANRNAYIRAPSRQSLDSAKFTTKKSWAKVMLIEIAISSRASFHFQRALMPIAGASQTRGDDPRTRTRSSQSSRNPAMLSPMPKYAAE
jgi:hypothetical protein